MMKSILQDFLKRAFLLLRDKHHLITVSIKSDRLSLFNILRARPKKYKCKYQDFMTLDRRRIKICQVY
ncbi:hypothetical protein ACI8B_50528 [Acinetobacter proteolyticus]|uniref:Uncharacterized protein n=1 Tax=Acinetobacter proteolyticus TaxID=1776741 RepID=A0A653KAM4_9GAMM|nr:hypothetical protein ACI8B_50528 [Acinetobacter proteolyticus]